MLPEGLLILGFGGHARSAADVAISAGIRSLLFVDANARQGERFAGYPVQSSFAGPMPEGWACLPAAGDGRRRKEQVEMARAAGWPLATVVSPRATIGIGATLGEGCFVGHHAHVGPMTRIGVAAIINTGAAVEHDCVLGDYVHVSVNATAAGWSRLGDFVFLGAGSTVIDGVAVGDGITTGAGTVVVAPLRCPGIYVGAPARQIKTSDPKEPARG